MLLNVSSIQNDVTKFIYETSQREMFDESWTLTWKLHIAFPIF